MRCELPVVGKSRFAAFLLLCVFPAAVSPLRAAATDSVQLELNPNSIQLAAGESAQVLLVIRNQTAATITGLKLNSSGDTGIQVEFPKTLAPSLEAHSAAVIPVSVERPREGSGLGTLNFWISWQSPDTRAGAAIVTLRVDDRSFLGMDKLASIRLESAVDHLDENESAELYIIVSNIGPVPTTVTGLQTNSPKFVPLKVPPVKPAVVLQPLESHTFPIEATVTDRALAGNQRVVIDADLKWQENGAPRSGTLSIAQTLPVTIFGESDLLKAVGVPSFLFLPGFLFLATFGSLWKRISPRTKPAEPYTAAEIALASVSLSLLATKIYPIFEHHSYLQGYGVGDVMAVWFGSILAAGIVWSGAAGGPKAWHRWEDYRKRKVAERAEREEKARILEHTPTKNDSPVQMLTRMIRAGMSMPPDQAMVSLGGAPAARGFVVMRPSQGQPKVWLAPPVELALAKGAASSLTRKQIEDKLKQTEIYDSYEHLRDFLYSVQNAGWQVVWGDSGAIVGPTPVAQTDIKEVNPAQGFELIQLSS